MYKKNINFNKKIKNFKKKIKLKFINIITKKTIRTRKFYNFIEKNILKFLRYINDIFDKILFNYKHSKIITFFFTFMVFLAFNSTNKIDTSQQVKEFMLEPLIINYNKDLYEVNGIDSNIKIILIGHYIDITATDKYNCKVIIDLNGLNEGYHKIKYSIKGINSKKIKTIISPDYANIEIKIKETKTMPLGYDFINENKLDPQFVLGIPILSSSEVILKASKDILQKIAFVKTLIDVTGQTSSFSKEAIIVAYNERGEKIHNVDIIPSTINVNVEITSPFKTVPIKPILKGDIPNDNSIQNIIFQFETIKIYGKQDILDTINDIPIIIDASTLFEDTKLFETITLPSGVKAKDSESITLDIKLGKTVKKNFKNIQIRFINNYNRYRFDIKPEDVYTDIEISGCEENIENIDLENIKIFIDLKDIEPNNNIESILNVDSSIYPYIKVLTFKKSIIYNLIK